MVSHLRLYPLQARKARQARHFLDTRGGAQGVVSHHGLYPLQARKAWQAWHFLDTRWGARGVAQGLTGATDGINSAAATAIMHTCFTSAIIAPAIF